MAARTLAKLIGGKGRIAMIAHAPGSASTMDRERGFEETIKSEYPGITIVARQFGMSDRAKARAATENILTAQSESRWPVRIVGAEQHRRRARPEVAGPRWQDAIRRVRFQRHA